MNVRTRSRDDEQTIQYLLGRLSDEVQSSFERDVMATKESFEHVLALEDDLMYDYLQGELSSQDRKRFAERYVVSAEGRQKETFANVLLDWVTRQPKVYKPGFEFWRVLQFATASLALCTLVFSLWLHRESRQVRTLVSQVVEKTTVAHNLTAQASPPPPVVLFFLEPGLNRSAGGPKRLRITPAAVQVRLRLNGQHAELDKAYVGTLRTTSGVEVWSTNGLLFQREPNGVVLPIELPAAIFLNGEYVLILRTSDVSSEELDYHFAVGR